MKTGSPHPSLLTLHGYDRDRDEHRFTQIRKQGSKSGKKGLYPLTPYSLPFTVFIRTRMKIWKSIIALDKTSNIIYPSFIVIPSWFI